MLLTERTPSLPLSCCMPSRKTANPVRERTSREKTSKKLCFGVVSNSRGGEAMIRSVEPVSSPTASTRAVIAPNSITAFSRSAEDISKVSHAGETSEWRPRRISHRGDGTSQSVEAITNRIEEYD